MALEEVRDVIVEVLNCNAEDVVPEASLYDDLGADSLDAVELSMAFEERFDVSIPEEKLPELVTVADVVALIESLQA